MLCGVFACMMVGLFFRRHSACLRVNRFSYIIMVLCFLCVSVEKSLLRNVWVANDKRIDTVRRHCMRLVNNRL